MSKFIIKSVRYGCSNGGMACGPCFGTVVAELRLLNEETGREFFMSLAEFEGIPNYYKTEESSFDFQIEEPDNEKAWAELNKHLIPNIGDYDEIPEDNEYTNVYKYLAYVVRSTMEDCNKFISETIEKDINEIEIPVIEDEYDDDEDEEED